MCDAQLFFSLFPDSGHGPILFYNRDQPYYDFTNFAEYALCYWTSENYFQSQKLIGTLFLRNLCELPHPRQAFEYPRQTHMTRLAHGQG